VTVEMLSTNGIYEGANPIRVLHVEDELGAIKITRVYLEKAGYNNFEITPVLTAEQALEKLENEDFDVVISDYMMPGMDGLKFLEELRKKGNDIPFIIFTGRGEEGVAIEALNKGANRYIKKEGNPATLFRTLGQYIQEVIEEGKKGQEAHDVLSPLLGEEKKLKCLETDSKEQVHRESHIDAGTLLNEHLDLIILGLLVDQPTSDDDIKSMSEEDLIGGFYRKFGIKPDSKTLHTSVVTLKENGIITYISGRMTITPFYLR